MIQLLTLLNQLCKNVNKTKRSVSRSKRLAQQKFTKFQRNHSALTCQGNKQTTSPCITTPPPPPRTEKGHIHQSFPFTMFPISALS